VNEVVIVSTARTAIGDFTGAIKNVSALELGKIAITEAISRGGIKKEDVDEIIMGNVLPGGLGQNPARQAMLLAGLPANVGAITVNKVCGSGLKAAMLASQVITCGDADVIVAGGMENMFLAPYYLPKAREGYRLWDGKIIDGMVHDGLWDAPGNYHMGVTAENVADKFKVTRQDQDAFSMRSYQKAQKAWAEGKFNEEIAPVMMPQKKGPPTPFAKDEGPTRETSLDQLGKLPTAFKDGGTVTAGNSSKLSIGGAALVLMNADKAKKLGIKPLAKVIAHGSAGIENPLTVAAPIYSIPKVLKKAGMTEKEIDVHEINEAFAAAAVAIMKELRIDEGKVNLYGGAISMGHPIGCSGARLLVTLLSVMKANNLKHGMVSLCLGGGEAVTMLVQKQ
jgi:acetyl-CoA C-acetyltransferase